MSNRQALHRSAPAALDVGRDLQRLVLQAAVHCLHLQLQARHLEGGDGCSIGHDAQHKKGGPLVHTEMQGFSTTSTSWRAYAEGDVGCVTQYERCRETSQALVLEQVSPRGTGSASGCPGPSPAARPPAAPSRAVRPAEG